MKAVILAGGYGIRLRPITFLIPKPLLAIGDKSLLEIIISKLKKYGIKDFIFATGYKSELIETYFQSGKKWRVKIKYIKEKKPLGTAGIISEIPKSFVKKNESFILMNGDIVTNLNFKKFMAFHNKNKFHITVALKKIREKSPYGSIEYKGDKLIKIKEKPTRVFNASAGIYLIHNSVRQLVKKKTFFTIPGLITDALKKEMKVGVYEVKEYWLGVEQIQHFKQAYSHKEKWD
ncbi:MAG: NTP transferase domain-containing protein [Candidatus Omnitrophica bacterium]|nr:NTP transferase domain-containing protein [Candidatus Omnitrophota bacterium]